MFDNVSFKYERSNDKAINDINISIAGGSMAAFVGHSGAGKSTIINLLPRFYDPLKGKICVDNQDIKNINLNSLRKNRHVLIYQLFKIINIFIMNQYK